MGNRCIICCNQRCIDLFTKNNFCVVKCEVCGFVFLNPLPKTQELEEYYKQFDYKLGFKNERLIRHDARRTLTNLRDLGHRSGSLLDVGCGAGFFMDEARKLGWQVYGIDTSLVMIRCARNRFKLNVTRGDFNKFNFPEVHYNVITLIQMIEHLMDPHPTLRRINRLLERKGMLCVSTPNIDSHLANVLKEDFNYMIPPEHVGFYSPHTLRILLESSGFMIRKMITWGYSSDLAAIIKRLIKGKIKSGKREIEEIKNNTLDYFMTKKIKSILFEKVFCKMFYLLLNINYKGSILEIYAEKK